MAVFVRLPVVLRCGMDHRHFGLWIANNWRALTSNHAQSLPMAKRSFWRANREDPLQQDFGLTGPVWTTIATPISSLRRMQGFGGLRVLRHVVAIAKNHAICREEGIPPNECLWQQSEHVVPLLWVNRPSKPTPRNLDFRHMKANVALLLNSRHNPSWVHSQVGSWDSVMKWPPQTTPTTVESQGAFGRLAEHDNYLEVDMCRKLCEDGRITDAVDMLNIVVQRGCHVPTNLFYRALKWCTAKKDLAVGRRIHALTIQSGYDGDAFLATHLIGLYASHGRLEEAMHVFNKVLTPSSYNWATIIFAHARHGEAVQALRLYRQMLESTTVKPTNRIYVAVLKACATGEDLGAGKEVHERILASPGKPDKFVQTALVNMYAKCRSLADARRVFENYLQRDVVTWTTMIAGYSQQGMGQEALTLYSRMQEEGITPPDCVTYTCLLQACASVGVGALRQGKQLHRQIAERGLQGHVVLGASLVTMYTRCGSLEDAHNVFNRLPCRNVMTWTALIAGYVQHGMGQEALGLYSGMQQERLIPDSVTYVCLLHACAGIGVGALHQGRQLHEQIAEQGLQDDVVLGGSLVHMYTRCGSLEDAHTVFDTLSVRNMLTWTAMIAGYVQLGMGQEALSLYSSMEQECLAPPDSVAFVCLLQACAKVGVGAVHQGKHFHQLIAKQGLQEDVVLGGSLVNMYAKCGSLEDAHSLFDRLPVRNAVTWTALIAGYAQQGMGQEALSIYNSMQEECLTLPDSVIFVSVLQACASLGEGGVYQGEQIRTAIEEQGLEDDVVVGGSLVNMYAKCGSLEDARRLFDRLPEKNLVTWNAMLSGYAQQGMCHEAVSLYQSMQQECLSSPDSATFVCLLQACANVGVGAVHQGKQVHAHTEVHGLEYDVVVGSSLVNMYAMCSSLEDARSVFDRLPERNVGTWNAMLAGYAQQGLGLEALTLYSSMQEEGVQPPDSVTFLCLLRACVILGDVHQGKRLHTEIEQRGLLEDIVLGASLVNMYAKCGNLEEARNLFDRLPGRSVVTWTAMIAGYAQQGMNQEALTLYSSMQQEGLTPDSVTYLCLLEACAILAALPLGKQLHAQIKEQGLEDVAVGAALVNMYAKCGSMIESQQVFDSLPQRTVEACGALAVGYARNGDSVAVFDLVDRMRLESIQPNVIISLSVLTVCSHVGLVDKGLRYFEAMNSEYGINPTAEHYTCVMDLLGRAGHLERALLMAKTMPFPPDGTVWRTLLGACRKWNDIELAQQAFEFGVSVDAKDSASYVLMSNIYANAEMWEEAKAMQARRKQFGAWKQPGQCWWTDLDGVVHTFVVGDKTHPESDDYICKAGTARSQYEVGRICATPSLVLAGHT